jgi:hypothetical protein
MRPPDGSVSAWLAHEDPTNFADLRLCPALTLEIEAIK